ncbi:MAG: hypothetical protein V1875_02705 [Candidatus Altiarchaeota archaeon]
MKMELLFSDNAKRQLEKLPPSMKPIFLKHFEKILEMPPRRHMKYGIPYHVDEVTKQAGIVFECEDEKVRIVQCFTDHKEYERWYKGYR